MSHPHVHDPSRRAEIGREVAVLLRGSWRAQEVVDGGTPASFIGRGSDALPPFPPAIDEQIAGALILGGAAGLVAPRLRDASSDMGMLQATYRKQILAAALQRTVLHELIDAFDRRGIDVLILKGLAALRHYPYPGARPVGDIDLLVPAEQLSAATAALQATGFVTSTSHHGRHGLVTSAARHDAVVDLQTAIWPLDDPALQRAVQSAPVMDCEGSSVHVLPLELEIWHYAVHAARHRFMRPIWLCDLAAAIESACTPNWESILSGPRQTDTWVRASVWLATHLLDLQLPQTVQEQIGERAWLRVPVLARWGQSQPRGITPPAHRLAEAIARRNLSSAFAAGRAAWTDRLEAAAEFGWPFAPAPATAAVPLLVGRRAIQFARAYRRYAGTEKGT